MKTSGVAMISTQDRQQGPLQTSQKRCPQVGCLILLRNPIRRPSETDPIAVMGGQYGWSRKPTSRFGSRSHNRADQVVHEGDKVARALGSRIVTRGTTFTKPQGFPNYRAMLRELLESVSATV